MPRETVPRPSPTAEDGEDFTESDRQSAAVTDERHSVSDLVSRYGEPLSEPQKRGRSESGDPNPTGKRGARGEPSGLLSHSPSTQGNRNLREHLDAAIDNLETRIMTSISRDLHEFRETLSAEIARLSDRLRDLERHVEERDGVISDLTEELRQSRADVAALQTRIEDAEINSRLPSLVLSGPAMASRHAPRLEPPLRGAPAAPGAGDRSRPLASAAPPGAGESRSVTSQSADRRDGGGPARAADAGRQSAGAPRAGDWEEREDINALVVDTLNRSMPGLNMSVSDIDRAHRLPGPNNRVIVKFVRSGEGSVRDLVMSRRLELRGRDLFVNESLTKLRGLIFRSLLAAKREGKIYTVYSRGGHVFYKEKQHGAGKRVNSTQSVREMGIAVLER